MDINRIDFSREQLLQAFYYALGQYADQEEWKLDEWRDKTIGEMFVEFNAKFGDIAPHMSRLHTMSVSGDNRVRRDSAWDLLRHCTDLTGMSIILQAKVMEKVKLFK